MVKIQPSGLPKHLIFGKGVIANFSSAVVSLCPPLQGSRCELSQGREPDVGRQRTRMERLSDSEIFVPTEYRKWVISNPRLQFCVMRLPPQGRAGWARKYLRGLDEDTILRGLDQCNHVMTHSWITSLTLDFSRKEFATKELLLIQTFIDARKSEINEVAAVQERWRQ